ncbi:sperm microtubule associated protein 2 isoform X1 [Triplophysa dalaica]|uniref:sperm microtubule associated protein 2 isoform X1 n=1 Tax=Triplophysa dalaica TaxID=1582913 RepID=UPI0024DFF200|nr:sperm microtubule associated protein 2 isoform X1 [Triplophysa dalaica]XP_056598889.1 sperm microtubule associated protein 2 isoform X1 [Triplophysa dalaica]
MASQIDLLAHPKPNLLKFPDRRSVYWLDELPAESKKNTTTFEMTSRLEQLAQNKQAGHFFENRRSSEWVVSAAALKARPSQRICSLALPREPAEGWQLDRQLLVPWSVAVQTVRASPRICQLAQPKRMKMMSNGFSAESSGHTVTVPTVTPSARLLHLASPKQVHPQHALDRPVSWPIPNHILKTSASERLHLLARPKTRQALFEAYDPYSISPAARAATASPRLLELSLPLPRKCKT